MDENEKPGSNTNIPPLPSFETPVSPPAPQPPTPPTPKKPENQSNAVSIVLQWLSYGLWEWMLCTLSVLLSAVLSYYFVSDTRDGDFNWIVYVVAAMIVLSPFAFITNRLYSKREPEHKHGFAAVVMVLNAIIVFLAAIGGLITFVVSLLNLLLSSSKSPALYITIISSLVVAILALMLFLRIMYFAKLQRFNRLFPLIVVVIAGITAIAALAGPFRAEVELKNDRLIENNLSALNSAIQDYARKNKKLPDSLNDLDLSSSYREDAKLLITKSLVTYEKKATTTNPAPLNSLKATNPRLSYATQTATYELCAIYKQEKRPDYYDRYTEDNTTYISSSSHKAGKQCYTQTVTLGLGQPYPDVLDSL